MRRRIIFSLLVSATLTSTPAAIAQKTPARIALLGSGSGASSAIFVEGLREGLRENGLVEGPDYLLDVRWAEGDFSRFPVLALELLQQNPRVILASTGEATKALQSATTTVPIVMTTVTDPVGSGLVESLARPGRNTTGLSTLNEDVTPKLIELLHALKPTAKTVAALYNPANPSHPVLIESLRAVISPLGVTLDVVEMRPNRPDYGFETLSRAKLDALIVLGDAGFFDLRERIADLSAKHQIAIFSPIPELTLSGALASYGHPRRDFYRRSAFYVRKLLDGATAAELPVEQPTRIVLSLNLKTARQLNLAIPDTLLARADEVIE
jgi:putative tryptophan/tyrosine transport system substrate-binding protein